MNEIFVVKAKVWVHEKDSSPELWKVVESEYGFFTDQNEAQDKVDELNTTRHDDDPTYFVGKIFAANP